jgi:hypothetical protein
MYRSRSLCISGTSSQTERTFVWRELPPLEISRPDKSKSNNKNFLIKVGVVLEAVAEE